MSEIWAYFLKGGIIHFVLLFAYAIGMLIALERLIYYWWRSGSYQAIKTTFNRLHAPSNPLQNLPNSPEFRQFKRTPCFALLQTYVTHFDLPDALLCEKVMQEGRRQTQQYDAMLWSLSMIAHLAPLLGLLGTIVGLIKSFKAMESLDGGTNIPALAGGIWEAMLTTASGLVVAIILFFTYKLLDQYVSKKANELSDWATHLNVSFGRSLNTPDSHAIS